MMRIPKSISISQVDEWDQYGQDYGQYGKAEGYDAEQAWTGQEDYGDPNSYGAASNSWDANTSWDANASWDAGTAAHAEWGQDGDPEWTYGQQYK